MAKSSRIIGATKPLVAKRTQYGWICSGCGNVTLEYRSTRLVVCLNGDCTCTTFDPCFVVTPTAEAK